MQRTGKRLRHCRKLESAQMPITRAAKQSCMMSSLSCHRLWARMEIQDSENSLIKWLLYVPFTACTSEIWWKGMRLPRKRISVGRWTPFQPTIPKRYIAIQIIIISSCIRLAWTISGNWLGFWSASWSRNRMWMSSDALYNLSSALQTCTEDREENFSNRADFREPDLKMRGAKM